MSETLEKRVESLEREFAELREQALDLPQLKKNWRSTVGILEDDEMTREAERFGRETEKRKPTKKKLLVLDTDHVSVLGRPSQAETLRKKISTG